MNRIPFIIAVLVFCAGISVSHAELYKWVDQDGVEHFSNSEPENQPASKVETEDEIPYDAAADAERKIQDQKIMEKVSSEEAEMKSESQKAVEQSEPPPPAPAVIIEEEHHSYGDDNNRRQRDSREEEVLDKKVRREKRDVREEEAINKKVRRVKP